MSGVIFSFSRVFCSFTSSTFLPAAIYITKYHCGEVYCVLCKTKFISNLVTARHLHTNRTTVHQNSTDAVPVSHILLVTYLCLCVPNPLALGADSLSSHCDVSRSKKHNLGLFFWVGAARNVDSNAINFVAHNTCSRNPTFKWANRVVRDSFLLSAVTDFKTGHDRVLRK